LVLQIRDEDEEFLDDIAPPNDQDFDADEDEDGQLDDDNNNNNNNDNDNDNDNDEGSGRTSIGVWMSEKKMKSMMVDAVRTVLHLQHKPSRKGQCNNDEVRMRKDALDEEKAYDQCWQRLIFMVSRKCQSHQK
jgi:ABC-type Zn2+ transport system substrate-binding protein/surface adhesin